MYGHIHNGRDTRPFNEYAKQMRERGFPYRCAKVGCMLHDYTPVTLCNFVLGPNAILPTGGFAKTYSSVSVQDFLKRSSVGYASKDGFENVRDYAYRFAKVEGFDTHGLAVKERK